ncbi:MAG: hypothetical protein DPW11_03815 [bacterium]|nr:hypothetical protein [Candidatus Microgenomates bacterium CPR3]MCQ3944875.1 hypothetical protein [bacterium]RIK52246.1 MAG: hypothetical protein DCC61_00465 [Candidatus Microgenomates bacterium]
MTALQKLDRVFTILFLLVMIPFNYVVFNISLITTMACDNNCSSTLTTLMYGFLALALFIVLSSFIYSLVVSVRKIKAGQTAFWVPVVGMVGNVIAMTSLIASFLYIIFPLFG